MTPRLLASFVLAASACGASPSAGDDDDAGDAGPPDAVLGELVIELAPVDAVVLPIGPALPEIEPSPAPGAPPTLRVQARLPLALGDGYPTRMSIALPDALWLPCGALRGEMVIDDAQAGGLAIEIVDATHVRLDVSAAGDHAATLTGALRLDPSLGNGCVDELAGATDLDLRIDVEVPVRRPAAVAIARPSACTEAAVPSIHTRVPLGSAHDAYLPLVTLLDDTGAPLHPANATRERPATVTVLASEDTSLALADEAAGLAALLVDGPPGPVRIEPALAGEALELRLVDTADITAMTVTFALPGAASGPVLLPDGATLGEEGWRRTFDRVVPVVSDPRVGADPLCTAIDPRALVLHTDTASTCVPEAWPPEHGLGVLPEGVPAPMNALVAASGPCALELEAEAANDGAGLRASLHVTLLEVEGLISLAEIEGR